MFGGRDYVSSAVPADIAERISDRFDDEAVLNREADERGEEAAAKVRQQAAAGDPAWIEQLVDDVPLEILRRLFNAREYPRVQAVVWADAIDLAADYAWQKAAGCMQDEVPA